MRTTVNDDDKVRNRRFVDAYDDAVDVFMLE